jgi:hypothetical protein
MTPAGFCLALALICPLGRMVVGRAGDVGNNCWRFVGGLLVLLGTALVTGFSLRALFGRSKQQEGQA